MKRAGIVAMVSVLGVIGSFCIHASLGQDESAPKVQWIWHNDKTPDFEQQQGTHYFRKVFTINRDVQKPVDEGVLDITADDEFSVWINGTLVGKGTTWQRVYAFDVQKLLKHGPNVIAVEATNTSPGPAGLLVRLGYVPNGQSKLVVTSDATWISSKTAHKDWLKVDFFADGW